MQLVQNIPFFTIMLSMFSGTISSVLPGRVARRLNTLMLSVVSAMSAWLLLYMTTYEGGSYIYMMGHFPAPWGNELRAGSLEALLALVFSVVMVLSLEGGKQDLFDDISAHKQSGYCLMVNLMMASLLALVYTNDMFTAYVFIEINAITACALVMARRRGHSLVASIRYLVMSCVASGLFLMGITLLYNILKEKTNGNTKREVIKNLVKDLRKINPDIKKSLFAAIKNKDNYLLWDKSGQNNE